MGDSQAMKSLEQELLILRDWICLHWGFCNVSSSDEWLTITKCKSLEAHEFAIAVLRAEGFDHPEAEANRARLIRGRFIEHFGTTVVFQEQFNDEDDASASGPLI